MCQELIKPHFSLLILLPFRTPSSSAVTTQNDTVRITFNGNAFHPAIGLFKQVFADLLHSYCLGQDQTIQAFARPEIINYSATNVAFFRVKLL